jgi:hypothetical protein
MATILLISPHRAFRQNRRALGLSSLRSNRPRRFAHTKREGAGVLRRP